MKAAGKTYKQSSLRGREFHGFRFGEAPDATEANKKAREEAWNIWKKLYVP